ncbi:hypothetical protein GCM10011414_18100 [Croceivirga lutea]|uniref:acetyl-CoA carboxylase biotin carboxyl carrier protein subunit n=1 Tax=Croceivirga lutea TaxID=1775167 RepID=UPI00163AA2E3|nr:acetyl-CoA carboxylase biotin carboxyl carrier protein subunit [Croceivirga lutea]GGG48704.1 hypothetical protein GCM10011414_18100 [Croceivirga lutea]
MKNKYKVVANTDFEVLLTKEDLEGLDLLPLSNSTYHLVKDQKNYHISFENEDFNKRAYEVIVNNNKYVVAIKNAVDLRIEEMGFQLNSASMVSNIQAPMPGLILEISVTVGQEVNEGDSLLILEAMKMENVISSPRAGIIKSIDVAQGDAVNKKQLLITFEA